METSIQFEIVNGKGYGVKRGLSKLFRFNVAGTRRTKSILEGPREAQGIGH